MKTVVGKNNMILVENLDGSFNNEMEIDNKTSIITSSDTVHEFNTHEELRNFLSLDRLQVDNIMEEVKKLPKSENPITPEEIALMKKDKVTKPNKAKALNNEWRSYT